MAKITDENTADFAPPSGSEDWDSQLEFAQAGAIFAIEARTHEGLTVGAFDLYEPQVMIVATANPELQQAIQAACEAILPKRAE